MDFKFLDFMTTILLNLEKFLNVKNSFFIVGWSTWNRLLYQIWSINLLRCRIRHYIKWAICRVILKILNLFILNYDIFINFYRLTIFNFFMVILSRFDEFHVVFNIFLFFFITYEIRFRRSFDLTFWSFCKNFHVFVIWFMMTFWVDICRAHLRNFFKVNRLLNLRKIKFRWTLRRRQRFLFIFQIIVIKDDLVIIILCLANLFFI